MTCDSDVGYLWCVVCFIDVVLWWLVGGHFNGVTTYNQGKIWGASTVIRIEITDADKNERLQLEAASCCCGWGSEDAPFNNITMLFEITTPDHIRDHESGTLVTAERMTSHHSSQMALLALELHFAALMAIICMISLLISRPPEKPNQEWKTLVSFQETLHFFLFLMTLLLTWHDLCLNVLLLWLLGKRDRGSRVSRLSKQGVNGNMTLYLGTNGLLHIVRLFKYISCILVRYAFAANTEYWPNLHQHRNLH